MRSRFLLVVATALAFSGGPVRSAQPQADSAVTTVSLGTSIGPPGGRVTVSVALTTAPGVDVGEFETTVMAPSPQLSFVTSETGGLADGVDADLVEEKLPAAGGKGGVKITLSTFKGKATRQPLPNGVLVYLLFAVNKDAKRGETFTLDATGTALTLADPRKPVAPFAVKGTTVKVGDAPITSCFFYMH